ncbi:hypothetical protein [Endozoicomonas sp. YOMI1]|uniref:hypothetical protein n=1 Tax=Endozoicomonas sp. YOMI1 TaxID=2828739 RepID=UPI00214955D2|nr:hypothetical protein [Endozoicomonas sp. YOMI1]
MIDSEIVINEKECLPVNRLNKQQIDWFKDATARERDTFLAKGEAGAIELLDADGMMKVYAPAIRGHIIGEPKASFDEARHYAEVRLHPLQIRANLNGEPVDEHALGITGFHGEFVQQAREENLRFKQIIHLGSELAHCNGLLPAHLLETLQSIVGENREQLQEHLPLFLLDEEEEDGHVGQLGFNDSVAKDQAYGFLVCAETPVPQVFNREQAIGDWDYTATWWFYDETIERIWAQARAWCQAYLVRRREVALQV